MDMRVRTRPIVLLATLVIAAGCARPYRQAAVRTGANVASNGTDPTTPVPYAASLPLRRTRDLLTALEIEGVPTLAGATADDAIRRLRREFLVPLSATRVDGSLGGPPDVMVDDLRQGGIETLRSIPVSRIAWIRYVLPADATRSYGAQYTSGLIVVVTKR